MLEKITQDLELLIQKQVEERTKELNSQKNDYKYSCQQLASAIGYLCKKYNIDLEQDFNIISEKLTKSDYADGMNGLVSPSEKTRSISTEYTFLSWLIDSQKSLKE